MKVITKNNVEFTILSIATSISESDTKKLMTNISFKKSTTSMDDIMAEVEAGGFEEFQIADEDGVIKTYSDMTSFMSLTERIDGRNEQYISLFVSNTPSVADQDV